MPTDNYKVLYQGQLPSSVGTLATVPSGKNWIIKHIVLVNNDASPRTFALYVNGTAAANIVTPTAVSIPAGGSYEKEDITWCLGASETLRGVASVATQVTITVFGDEVTL